MRTRTLWRATVCLALLTLLTGWVGVAHGGRVGTGYALACTSTAAQVLSSHPSRTSAVVYNTDTVSAVYLHMSASISAGQALTLPPGASWSSDGASNYRGGMWCITDSASVQIRVQEEFE